MAESIEDRRNAVAARVLTKESQPEMRQRDQTLAESVGSGLAVLMDDMGVSESELNEFMKQQGGKPEIKAAAEQLMRSKVAEKYPDYSQEQIDSLFAGVTPKAEQTKAESQEKEFEASQVGADEKTRQNQGQANQSAVPSSYKDRLNQMFQVYK